jgi:hypothetical protein
MMVCRQLIFISALKSADLAGSQIVAVEKKTDCSSRPVRGYAPAMERQRGFKGVLAALSELVLWQSPHLRASLCIAVLLSVSA